LNNTKLIFLLAVVFSSCQTKPIFQKFYVFEKDIWTYGNQLEFTFNVIDTAKNYNLDLVLQHKNAYSFENIYLKITTEFPDSNSSEKTLSIDMADNVGRWNGNCHDNKCKLRVFLLENFYFPEKGKYTIKLEQFTRIDSLGNLLNLKMILSEAE